MRTYSGGKHYDYFIDNVILLLEEIDRNKDTYTSIFDSPILNHYKQLHDEFGSCFTLCSFYRIHEATAVKSPYAAQIEVGWDMSRMTDKFKSEWESNSDWLRFNFHAWDYSVEYGIGINTSRNMGTDWLKMKNEVVRFAGEKSWMNNIARMHSISATPEQLKQIRAQNVRVLFFASAHTGYSGYNFTEAEKFEIYDQGVVYRENEDILYVSAAGRPEFVTKGIQGFGGDNLGQARNMYDYFNEFVAGTNPIWYKTPLNYLSMETHEYDIWDDPVVWQGYIDTARWMQDNGYTPKFFEYVEPTQLDAYFKSAKNWVSPKWM